MGLRKKFLNINKNIFEIGFYKKYNTNVII